MRKEVVEEFFIEMPLHDDSGKIIPAPLAAIFMRDSLKRQWHAQDLGPGRKTLVSLGPALRDGREGYSIRKEIVYP